MGVRELVGDANGVPASEKAKRHWSSLSPNSFQALSSDSLTFVAAASRASE